MKDSHKINPFQWNKLRPALAIYIRTLLPRTLGIYAHRLKTCAWSMYSHKPYKPHSTPFVGGICDDRKFTKVALHHSHSPTILYTNIPTIHFRSIRASLKWYFYYLLLNYPPSILRYNTESPRASSVWHKVLGNNLTFFLAISGGESSIDARSCTPLVTPTHSHIHLYKLYMYKYRQKPSQNFGE